MEQFAVPDGKHWVDMTEEGTIVVIDQPEGQSCAAIGGIMANRMKTNGVEGCVVGGRIRDLAELKASGLPVSFDLFSSTMATSVNFSILTSGQVFAMGRSTVGTGAEAKVLARNCPIKVQNVEISPVCPLPTSYFPPIYYPIHPPIYPSPLESKLTQPNPQGDIIFCDPLEGIVVLPANLLDDVLALMPTLVQADERVKEDVLNGSTVFDAFKKHRS